MFERVLMLKNSFFLNFAVLLVYVLVLNREGPFVPSNNEHVYLLYLAKFWDANVLANDWTFSGGLPSHFVFNLLFGPLTLVFPLVVVGWVGRILSWSLILIGLFKLAKHFQIPLWMITVSILLWLFYQQSIVGGEWVLGTFEAKGIAYALLFFALHGFMQQRVLLPSILLGLVFSFHPLVGLWAGLAVGLSLIMLRWPISAILKFTCYTVLFALPGLIPLLLTSFETESSGVWRFISLVVIPYHLDPYYFGQSKPHLLLLVMLLVVNYLHYKFNEKNHSSQFMICFQAFLGSFFVLGFLARFTESYKLLTLMPCRLFPVLLPLFFFFYLMSALQQCCSIKSGKLLVVAGLVSLAAFGNPITLLMDRVGFHVKLWSVQEDDAKKAFRWVAGNTPEKALVILPPWRGDSFYLSQRAQIASWWLPRFDRLKEWRERMEALTGDLAGVRERTTKARMEHMTAHYKQLTATDIATLVDKYGAEYLVSPTTYHYPLLFNAGTYKVYWLRGEGSARREG